MIQTFVMSNNLTYVSLDRSPRCSQNLILDNSAEVRINLTQNSGTGGSRIHGLQLDASSILIRLGLVHLEKMRNGESSCAG